MLYLMGLFIAGFLIAGTIAVAIAIQPLRDWWERRRRQP